MTHEGYAIASLAGADWTTAGSTVRHVSLTGRLGCTHADVEYYRLPADGGVTLSSAREALCVPLDAAGELTSGGTLTLPRRGVARGAVNETDRAVRWLMVGAPPTGGANEWDPEAEILEWPHSG